MSHKSLMANIKYRFATAYAITKVLLPLRIVFSVSATPWFVRVSIVPFTNAIKNIFRRKRMKPPTSGAAGIGAVRGGIVPGKKSS